MIELVDLAKETISSKLQEKDYQPPEEIKEKFSEKSGAFVTLKADGELRGCIGYTRPRFALYKTVMKAAKQAAFGDDRFSPLETLDGVDIEISVLTESKPVDNVDEINVGEDGLVLTGNGKRGIFLPQVATEQGWNKRQLLAAICQKAGLEKGAWKTQDLYKFQASVYKKQ